MQNQNMDRPAPGGLSITFKLTVPDYRRMMYFNTFGQRPVQSAILLLAWAACLVFACLDLFGIIGPLTSVVRACLWVVSGLIPLLVVTAEFNIHRFAKNRADELSAERRLTFTEEGVSQARSGLKKTGFEAWGAYGQVFESKTLFVIYRSATEILILPKRAVADPRDLEDLRALFREKLGRAFIRRV